MADGRCQPARAGAQRLLMIEYCLDTNVCIAIINGSSVPVRARMKAVLAAGSVVCVSSVVLHELWYGVAKSARQESNTERVRAFLSGPIRDPAVGR